MLVSFLITLWTHQIVGPDHSISKSVRSGNSAHIVAYKSTLKGIFTYLLVAITLTSGSSLSILACNRAAHERLQLQAKSKPRKQPRCAIHESKYASVNHSSSTFPQGESLAVAPDSRLKVRVSFDRFGKLRRCLKTFCGSRQTYNDCGRICLKVKTQKVCVRRKALCERASMLGEAVFRQFRAYGNLLEVPTLQECIEHSGHEISIAGITYVARIKVHFAVAQALAEPGIGAEYSSVEGIVLGFNENSADLGSIVLAPALGYDFRGVREDCVDKYRAPEKIDQAKEPFLVDEDGIEDGKAQKGTPGIEGAAPYSSIGTVVEAGVGGDGQSKRKSLLCSHLHFCLRIRRKTYHEFSTFLWLTRSDAVRIEVAMWKSSTIDNYFTIAVNSGQVECP
ncbi:hypothetical protein KCU92_g270, partial [Aureobasidium melanogenum]